MDARERLRQLVQASPLSQAEIARRCAKGPMWLSDRVRGHSAILADDVPLLAHAMGIDPCELLDGVGDPPATPEPPSPANREALTSGPVVSALEQMLAVYARELARAQAGEPMEEAVERALVTYLRELYRLETSDAQLVIDLAAKLGRRRAE
ncbi:MAG: hypothetical protein QOF51_2369 [Chloroflexota bacterium]|jgi:transcriptional regulator with XRE-family HTH domain|nr:hypothetical protein [Chloroflexota bacterium]